MTRILINKCYDIRRNKELTTSLVEYEEPAREGNYNLELKEALSALNEKYRIILTLFYNEGYHIDEIAKILKLSPNMVKTRLRRGKRNLQKIIITRMKGENDMKNKEENFFLKDIEMPGIVDEKIAETLLKIKMEEKDIMRRKENADAIKNGTIRKFVKPMIAVAACLILVAVVSTGRNIRSRTQDISMVPDSDESSLQKDIQSKSPFGDFSITAYANELDVAGTDDGNITFVDAGIGSDGYTGIMFNIQGDEISDVEISVDKGELYSASIEDTTEDALNEWAAQGMLDMDGNPDTYTIVETPAIEEGEDAPDIRSARLYHCTKRSALISDKYDREKYYGFYIPEQAVSTINDETDLAEAYHDMLNIFDGAVMTVKVSYSDGSSLQKEYELSAAKLTQDENGTITQEEWTGGDEGAFVYGIIGREQK